MRWIDGFRRCAAPVMLAGMLCVAGEILRAQSFPVIYKEAPGRDKPGELRMTGQGVEFQAEKSDAIRLWKYEELEALIPASRRELLLIPKPGQNGAAPGAGYRFQLTSGELSNAQIETIEQRVRTPGLLVAGGDEEKSREIPVRLKKNFGGGIDGTLIIRGDLIRFEAKDAKNSREWSMDRDIESLWAASDRELQIEAYDGRREFGRSHTYNFLLKDRVEPAFLHSLEVRLMKARTRQQRVPN